MGLGKRYRVLLLRPVFQACTSPRTQGLLKIRGEIKKSDTVAVLLATKAIQGQVEEKTCWSDGWL